MNNMIVRIFKRGLIIIGLGTMVFNSCKQDIPLSRVAVADFGAIPGDNQSDTEALRKAMAYCKDHPGTILKFEPGVYDFRDEKAAELMEGILGGKMKGNPQDSIFKPYYPYGKGLDFDGSVGHSR